MFLIKVDLSMVQFSTRTILGINNRPLDGMYRTPIQAELKEKARMANKKDYHCKSIPPLRGGGTH